MYDACIIGAGVSGLSLGRMLNSKLNLIILEGQTQVGGIARPRIVDGIPYHVTGGHCFNSKYPEVLEFVFENVAAENCFNLIERKAAIKFDKYKIPYPIELHIKEIFEHDPKLASDIITDFLRSDRKRPVSNLSQWFEVNFGLTLSNLYFEPYNRKIWNMEPQLMNFSWVQDKLPQPNVESFIRALLSSSEDGMPHSKFYYPKSNSQTFLIDRLAEGLNISLGEAVTSIVKCSKGTWIINNRYECVELVSTLPVTSLLAILGNCPEAVQEAATELKYNKITTMLWKSLPTNETWTYVPSSDSIFHRYIHIGNFLKPAKNYTITEAVGVRTREEMERQGRLDSDLLEPVDYHVSDHAYVVFDDKRDQALKTIFDYLKSIKVRSLGRFGQWDYFNMDVCMYQSLKLAKEMLSGAG